MTSELQELSDSLDLDAEEREKLQAKLQEAKGREQRSREAVAARVNAAPPKGSWVDRPVEKDGFRKCPVCGGAAGYAHNLRTDSHWVQCKFCGLRSPVRPNRLASFQAWNGLVFVPSRAQ